MIRGWVKTILIGGFLLGVTTLIFMYTSGYRVSKEKDKKLDLKKTGMISAKSIPEGANVYIDGELVNATNSTIQGVTPGTHNLKILKNGFVVWTKDIEVFPELVTDITAILISQSPRLEPLTNTGARFPIISPSLSKLAFFSKDGTSPGVWVIPLAEGGLSLFRTNPKIILEDTSTQIYSNGQSIEWSTDEENLLIQDSSGKYFVIDLSKSTAEATSSPNLLKKDWANELLKKRTDFINKIDIPNDMRDVAVAPETLWASDNKKFMYKVVNGDEIEYRVYNMEKPVPVGEKVETVVLKTKAFEPQPKTSWYSDSFHLVLAENDIETDKKGRVSLIRIDGTNKTEVYNNTLHSDQVFSAPGGDKLIILTSLKSGDQTDLYTIGIR